MKKCFYFLISIIGILLIESCQKKAINNNEVFNESLAIKKFSGENEFMMYDTRNMILEEMAKILAIRINQSSKLRKFIKQQALKQIDGDYDILLSNIKDSIVDGIKFKYYIDEIISDDIQDIVGSEFTENVVSIMPYVQISVPINIGNWDVQNYSPLVAYRPIGIPSEKFEYVKAFDPNGGLVKLPLDKEPNLPVIVIGISERYGTYINSKKDMIEPDPDGSGGGGSTSDDYCNRDVNIGKFDIISYASFSGKTEKFRYEPWVDGKSEVKIYVSYIYFDQNDNIIPNTVNLTGNSYHEGFINNLTFQDIRLQSVFEPVIDFDKDNYGNKIILSFFEYDYNDNESLKKLAKVAIKIFSPLRGDVTSDYEFEIDVKEEDYLIGAYEINYDDKEFFDSKGKYYNKAFDSKFGYLYDFYFYIKQ